MKPSRVAGVLDNLLPAGLPVLLKGKPGVGKTSLLLQAGERLGMRTMVCHPAVEDPTDYKGMPFVFNDEGKQRAEFIAFGNLQQMIDADEPTLVILDDLGQAPQSVQAAAMQPIGARTINGKKISPYVSFAAATNQRADNAGVTGLISPLLDRFATVLSVDFDLDDYVRWLIDNDYPAEIPAFARFKPDEISKTNAANKDMNKFATPRSVAFMGGHVKRGLLDAEVLAGAAGEAFATEFLSFYKIWKDLPSRDSIYANPDKVNVPTDASTLYALMGSLAYGANETNIAQTIRYLKRIRPAEFGVLCMKDALFRTPTLMATKEFATWVVDNGVVFGFDK